MLKIRLKITGNKKNLSYSIVLINSKRKRDGKVIKLLGYYNKKRNILNINYIRIKKGIQNGAKFTSRVKNMIINDLLFKNLNLI